MLRIRRYRVTAAVAAALAVVLSACSGTASDGGAEAPASPGAPAPDEQAPEDTAPGPSPASPSPDVTGGGADARNADVLAITAPDLEGGTLDLSQYAGRDVILWMWAPW